MCSIDTGRFRCASSGWLSCRWRTRLILSFHNLLFISATTDGCMLSRIDRAALAGSSLLIAMRWRLRRSGLHVLSMVCSSPHCGHGSISTGFGMFNRSYHFSGKYPVLYQRQSVPAGMGEYCRRAEIARHGRADTRLTFSKSSLAVSQLVTPIAWSFNKSTSFHTAIIPHSRYYRYTFRTPRDVVISPTNSPTPRPD